MDVDATDFDHRVRLCATFRRSVAKLSLPVQAINVLGCNLVILPTGRLTSVTPAPTAAPSPTPTNAPTKVPSAHNECQQLSYGDCRPFSGSCGPGRRDRVRGYCPTSPPFYHCNLPCGPTMVPNSSKTSMPTEERRGQQLGQQCGSCMGPKPPCTAAFAFWAGDYRPYLYWP